MDSATISLIVFGVCIVLFVWDKLPMATTAILGCTLMVILGACDFKTAFGQFASSTVVLTISVMVIGAAVSESGLAEVIGNWIVKISKGSETKLIIGTYLVSAAMSAFLTNSAVLALFLLIIMGLSSSSSKFKTRNLIMPISIACVLGGASTLVGSTQQLTAQGLLEDAGLKLFKIFDFTLVGSIIILIGLIYCLTIGKFLGNKIWGDREETEYKVSDNKVEYKNRKIIIMAIIFCLTVIFYITEWLPIAITATSAALLCIISGCISQEKAIKKINWNIVGRFGGCLGIAKALDVSGGTALIAQAFQSIVGASISPYLLFVILVFAALMISELTVASTALLVVLPIVFSIAPQMGLNTFTYALGITLATGCALSTPLASATLGISMVAGYKFNDYFKHNILLDIISFITIIILVPLIYGLTV